MKIPIFQVDVFTSKVFGGNPAAVCVLESWLGDETLQSIAAENNLPETAFIVKKGKHYNLRWFTPKIEIDLCGHATLASAFVIFSYLQSNLSSINFETISGILKAEKSENLLSMELPKRKPIKEDISPILCEALGQQPKEVFRSRDLLAIFENESQIKEMKPDFDKLKQIKNSLGLIISARGDSVDFVSRFFAPNAGILEDPVTGSAHCTLIPFWAERLGKSKLHAYQLSSRGGELFCEDMKERVRIRGDVIPYLKGDIYI